MRRRDLYRRTRSPGQGQMIFEMGDIVHYGEVGLPHEIVAVRKTECDASTGWISTITVKTQSLWRKK